MDTIAKARPSPDPLRNAASQSRRREVTSVFDIDTEHPSKLAHRRVHSGCDLEGGASAVPAGGLADRSRAALGISHAGTTAGAGGAVPGLGQVKAGNARGIRFPGSMAWS